MIPPLSINDDIRWAYDTNCRSSSKIYVNECNTTGILILADFKPCREPGISRLTLSKVAYWRGLSGTSGFPKASCHGTVRLFTEFKPMGEWGLINIRTNTVGAKGRRQGLGNVLDANVGVRLFLSVNTR